MLNSFERIFDWSILEKKLCHYFMDTAPIYADVELRMKEIRVICGDKSISVGLNDRLDIKENIYQIIKQCESLYPKMLNSSEQIISFSSERVKEMIIQGYSFEQIQEKEIKKNWNWYTITRFNTRKNTLDYKEQATGKIFRVHFNRPLITSRDTIIRLANAGRPGMMELYQFITRNSTVTELGVEDAAVSTNSD